MDALLKSNKDIYLKLFEEKIAELFCDVYENSVKATKHKLVLTYYSWEPFFSGQTMKKIQFLIRKKTGDVIFFNYSIQGSRKTLDRRGFEKAD